MLLALGRCLSELMCCTSFYKEEEDRADLREGFALSNWYSIYLDKNKRFLVYCSKNDQVGQKLIHCLQHYVPGLQAEAALRLEHGDVEEEVSLPVTLLTAITLNYIWKERDAGVSIRAYKVRAELEQYITLLRTTRLCTLANKLVEMSTNMFQ